MDRAVTGEKLYVPAKREIKFANGSKKNAEKKILKKAKKSWSVNSNAMVSLCPRMNFIT